MMFRRTPLTVVVSEGAPPSRTPTYHDPRTRDQKLADQAALDVALGLAS